MTTESKLRRLDFIRERACTMGYSVRVRRVLPITKDEISREARYQRMRTHTDESILDEHLLGAVSPLEIDDEVRPTSRAFTVFRADDDSVLSRSERTRLAREVGSLRAGVRAFWTAVTSIPLMLPAPALA